MVGGFGFRALNDGAVGHVTATAAAAGCAKRVSR